MWYYTLNNQQIGPVDEEEIKKQVASGAITQATLVWTTGMANWAPIGQSSLASLMGAVPPPVAPTAPPIVYEDPEVTKIKKLWTWFWVCLILAIPTFGAAAVASAVLFFILLYKAWKLVQHEGIRATADQAVAWCFIPSWNLYWLFPAIVGLGKELNAKLDAENVVADKVDLEQAKWMIISLYASFTGVGLVAFIVLWILYTKKVKNILTAFIQANK